MLPIVDIFDALTEQLTKGDCIVAAPPGAGKSTALPLHLIQQQVIKGKKIVMLQPRRIAARSIAFFLAQQLNEKVGRRVGYRIRGESAVSAETQLEIVTEGILTRMLQADPELRDVGLVIFDEFHERSIHADFSLALCLEVQQALREDLRLLVMSATLDSEAIQKLMPNALALQSQGRTFPIEYVYHTRDKRLSLTKQVSKIVSTVYLAHSKDILVFLPGKYEIHKVAQELSLYFDDKPNIAPEVHCLFSELTKDKQDKALSPANSGKRKIVLATNIAETSLTIEGIEVVVDSGIEKKAIFDLRKGLTQLTTQPISQASATQRAGRAGRLMPGTAYRLWSKELHSRLAMQSTPEILYSALDSLVLESSIWGASMNELALIDKPSFAQLAQAEDHLVSLGLVMSSLQASSLQAPSSHALAVTKLGKQVHALGTNPNIAVMLLRSTEMSVSHQSMACAIAALLENKDPLLSERGVESVELSLRLRFLLQNSHHPLWKMISLWQKKLAEISKINLNSLKSQDWPLHDAGIVVAFANPLWLAKQRANAVYFLANGSGAHVQEHDDIAQSEWLAVATLQAQSTASANGAVIRLAESITLASLDIYFSHMFSNSEEVFWDDTKQAIVAQNIRRFGDIILSRQASPKPSSDKLSPIWKQLLQKKFKENGVAALPLNDKATAWLARVRLLSKIDTSFPSLSDNFLHNTLDDWLVPYLAEVTTWKGFSQLAFLQYLKTLLTYPQQTILDEQVPAFYQIPTRRKVAIDYRDNGKAVVSVRIQEMYGLKTQPTILKGSLAITFELLSPAQRPIQTTDNIVGFFQGSYLEVQKEMKGRYPRHFWPDDPINAKPTTSTKKRMLDG
ncbi:ATP-dependent helicase HrpB [Glaciecola sp. MH2013]|uniref:ATP-dependent helicase HrpB n=1 Tax=Glaciecola sp. MH2013 TaxID=2785524 RepID=UPI00189EE4A4|nr:ATP-dependent helicase HrpB [Glaciecola sp. MH2013]MBF7071780.1 ATP-dependent helicase HrpB [Glaciecola sp. MH2013]